MKYMSRIVWFTLVEIVVSLTILSVIMVWVMMTFSHANTIATSTQSNRIVQENLKNVTETIAEDIRKNGIGWVSKTIGDPCAMVPDSASNFKQGSKLCTLAGNEYFLAKEVLWKFLRVDASTCLDDKEHCSVVKNGNLLTNSLVNVKKLEFLVSKSNIPYVTLRITLTPSRKNGIQNTVIQQDTITLQTSISPRQF